MPRTLPFSPIKAALGRRFSEDASFATTLEDEHRLVEGVLAQLEAMADALPTLPPASALESLALHLREALPAHCRHEERAMADTLAAADPATDDWLRATQRRAYALLQAEHNANETIAHELADAIEECAAAGAPASPEALGQLARQFFLLMRRHLAWEELVLSELSVLLEEAPASNV